jgi:hypothetical protein
VIVFSCFCKEDGIMANAESVKKEMIETGKFKAGGIWNWFDGPGDPCGRKTHWTWRPSQGSTYVGRGKCRDGYPMFELNLY